MARQHTGYAIDVAFDKLAGVTLYCTSTQEPGQEAGDDIDITTNKSVGYREYKPADLLEPSEFTVTAVWDPDNRAAFEDATTAGQGNVTFTYRECANRAAEHVTTLPNCWLKAWEPSEMNIGEMPTVTLTFGYAPGSGSSGA